MNAGVDPEILKRGGALHRPTRKILSFRGSKKAKVTLETKLLAKYFCQYFLHFYVTGPDPAFLIRGRPNSEIFLSGLRELFQKVQFFVVLKIS